MAINFDMIVTIAITQTVSTATTFYIVRFLNNAHDKIKINGKNKGKEEK